MTRFLPYLAALVAGIVVGELVWRLYAPPVRTWTGSDEDWRLMLAGRRVRLQDGFAEPAPWPEPDDGVECDGVRWTWTAS